VIKFPKYYILSREYTDALNLSYIEDANVQKEIEAIVQNYELKKTQDIGIKMTIILKDEEPIYQRTR